MFLKFRTDLPLIQALPSQCETQILPSQCQTQVLPSQCQQLILPSQELAYNAPLSNNVMSSPNECKLMEIQLGYNQGTTIYQKINIKH